MTAAAAPKTLSLEQPAHSKLPAEPLEVVFTPAEPSQAERDPGTGWLQPGGLVVHTGWSPPYPERHLPYRQNEAYEGAQSWHLSTPAGREIGCFGYSTRAQAEQAAATLVGELPQGTWPSGTPDDDPLYETAVDASTGPQMLPKRDNKGKPDWGYGAGWVNWRMPPTRALYDRMIAKHGGPNPTRYCRACREVARHARKSGWIVRSGHWPAWGAHAPGSVWRAHCHCNRCMTFVTIGALGTTVDTEGRTVPGALSACTTSPIRESAPVPYGERPFAWWRRLLTEHGHAVLDNRPCTGLWPEGVRHDDAFLCETGFTGTDDPNDVDEPDDVGQEADDHDQDDDPEGRADLEEQFAAAVRE